MTCYYNHTCYVNMLESVSPSTSQTVASSNSSLHSSSAENEGDSDDTIILQPSPGQRNRDDLTRLARVSFADGEIKMVILIKGVRGGKWPSKLGHGLHFCRCKCNWPPNPCPSPLYFPLTLGWLKRFWGGNLEERGSLQSTLGKKSLTDSRRRDMVKILVAHMASEHGYVVM